MPLLPCPDCGHQVSDQARSCPSCGYVISDPVADWRAKNTRDMKRILIVFFTGIALLLGLLMVTMPG